jgi:hypothetical protein
MSANGAQIPALPKLQPQSGAQWQASSTEEHMAKFRLLYDRVVVPRLSSPACGGNQTE